ncbi:acyl-CoA thioesterase [Hydrocarboniclastica marina]|uniref:Acyl-CoA thioesterase n=1 Tax=Hydrocarboniclastica marina TaxID=2259620 RepID=A0A4P7XFN1_9ALTE|nr:thioesterase family protein [Hydrocarboniclastica marina]QCF25779.1 acyl-CoA thioesterase [Hydrocarboniclastica marina]
MSDERDPIRRDFKAFESISTRWMDNDVYGHVNNVTYYSYFDTAVNAFLIRQGGLDIHNGDAAGFVVSSNCTYRRPIAFPEPIEAGIKVDRIGNSSVQYGVGIFRAGEDEPAAYGQFVHVFVSRSDNSSTPVPASIRRALEQLR